VNTFTLTWMYTRTKKSGDSRIEYVRHPSKHVNLQGKNKAKKITHKIT
jgi:hypothetical protein